MRQVPEKQIYGFALTTNEEMSRAEFHDSLQMPLAKKLEADGLWKFGHVTIPATNGQPERASSAQVIASKIRYAVLCYGVPLKIAPTRTFTRPSRKKCSRNCGATRPRWIPNSRGCRWSQMNFPLTGPLPNWLYGATNAASLNPTNGILLVARLDGPTRGNRARPGGQGDAGRTRRPVGTRLF